MERADGCCTCSAAAEPQHSRLRCSVQKMTSGSDERIYQTYTLQLGETCCEAAKCQDMRCWAGCNQRFVRVPCMHADKLTVSLLPKHAVCCVSCLWRQSCSFTFLGRENVPRSVARGFTNNREQIRWQTEEANKICRRCYSGRGDEWGTRLVGATGKMRSRRSRTWALAYLRLYVYMFAFVKLRARFV